jgi:hypothetical protein
VHRRYISVEALNRRRRGCDRHTSAAVTLPVTAQSTGTRLTSLTVAPFNPLTPPPRNNGLNSNYHYIGVTSAYQPGNELWCLQEGTKLVCSHHRP